MNGNGVNDGVGPRDAPFVTWGLSDNNYQNDPRYDVSTSGAFPTFGSAPTPAPDPVVYELPPIEVGGEATHYWLLVVLVLALWALSKRGQ